MRMCRDCHTVKPDSSFHVNQQEKDGLKTSCKSCTSAKMLIRRQKQMKERFERNSPSIKLCECGLYFSGPASYSSFYRFNKPVRTKCKSCIRKLYPICTSVSQTPCSPIEMLQRGSLDEITALNLSLRKAMVNSLDLSSMGL